MANKHVKRCSKPLITREMQVKTTLIYHLTPIRMATIKITENNKCCWECGKIGTLCTVGDNVNGYSRYGYSNSGRCKLVYSARKQISGCLGWGGEQCVQKEEEGRRYKGQEESFGGNGCVCHFNCDDGFTRIYSYEYTYVYRYTSLHTYIYVNL